MMHAQRCAELINDLAYKPEWTIKATPTGPGEVTVSFLIETVNTDRECAREGFPEKRTLNPENVFHCAPVSNEGDVQAVIMAMIMELEVHEAREFLRVKSDDFNAPFHPHRMSGEANWGEYFG